MSTSSIVVIILMLLLSAFFSGMEIAYLSKNRLKLEIDRKQSPMFDYIAEIFASNSGQYITTILVGNNIALVVYSLYMSKVIGVGLSDLGVQSGSWSVVIETAISTLIIIFTAEFLPKSIFRSNPNFYFKFFAPIIYLFYIVLYPIAKFTTMLSHSLLKLFGAGVDMEEDNSAFDKSDLASLIDGSGSHDVQAEAEKEIKLFQNALDFSDLRVRDCMTPRVDIEAVDINNITVEELTERFSQTKYSRLFVWRGSIDNIIGYINSKSLFRNPQSVDVMLREVTFVPETMQLNALLQSIIANKTNIAVVIDEFGGTAGVISMEDVLEQIFGEIEDEHDEPEMIEREISCSEYIFSSRLEVHYLNDKYNFGIAESDDYDTLAGFIIMHHKDIPTAGESLLIGRFDIKILRTTGSRIELARLKIIDDK